MNCSPWLSAISSVVRPMRRMSSSPLSTKRVAPAVGLHRPGARRREGADRVQPADLRHELAARQLLVDQRALRGRQVVQPIDPGQLVPLGAEQRQPLVGRGDRERAHRHHALVRDAVGAGQHQPAEGVALQCEAHALASISPGDAGMHGRMRAAGHRHLRGDQRLAALARPVAAVDPARLRLVQAPVGARAAPSARRAAPTSTTRPRSITTSRSALRSVRQPVGDGDGRAALHQVVERLLDLLLGLGVDRRGGLVEDQDARVDQQRARDARCAGARRRRGPGRARRPASRSRAAGAG